MDAVNWLLINGANAFWWLWGVAAALFALLWRAIEVALDPVLSPVLSVLNPVCTAIGDGVYAALALLPVWLGLTLISAVAGLLMLITFGYLSNQTAIVKAKDDIKANLLALKLYKDDLRVTFLSQLRVLWAIARLQRYMLTPILILLLPMLLGLAQMSVRYQWRPLRVGERTLVKLKPTEAFPPVRARTQTGAKGTDVALSSGPGLTVEAGPVPGGGEVVWRVRAVEPGTHTLQFNVGDATVEKELVVGDSFQRVSAARPRNSWTSRILHPIESALPRSSPVESIEIDYPDRQSCIHGTNYWVLHFFVVSMIVAVLFRPVFNVRF